MKTKVTSIFKIRQAAENLSVAKKRFDHLKVISENPGINIVQIMIALKISDHSAASLHVSELESIGWIKKVKEGRHETCYITDKAIKDCKSINKFINVKDKRSFR